MTKAEALNALKGVLSQAAPAAAAPPVLLQPPSLLLTPRLPTMLHPRPAATLHRSRLVSCQTLGDYRICILRDGKQSVKLFNACPKQGSRAEREEDGKREGRWVQTAEARVR